MRYVLYRSCIDSLTGKIVQRINCRLNARTRCGSIVPVLRDACRQTTPPWQSNSSLEQLSPSTRKIPSSIRRLNHLVVRGLVKRQLLVPQSLSLAVPRHPRQVPPSSFRPVCGPARRSRASQEYLEKVFNIRRVPVVGYVKAESEPGRLCRKYADARKRYTRDAERRRIERRIGRTRAHTNTHTHIHTQTRTRWKFQRHRFEFVEYRRPAGRRRAERGEGVSSRDHGISCPRATCRPSRQITWTAERRRILRRIFVKISGIASPTLGDDRSLSPSLSADAADSVRSNEASPRELLIKIVRPSGRDVLIERNGTA